MKTNFRKIIKYSAAFFVVGFIFFANANSAQAAIQYVGGQVGGVTPSTATVTNVTFALTGGTNSVPAAGDLVIVNYSVGSTADRTLTINNTSAVAYTLIGSELYQNGTTNDTNQRVAYRFMPATPETQVALGATGATTNGGEYTIHVFRNVDATTPLDVAAITAGTTGSHLANPGAITPTTSGAFIYVAGAGSVGTGAVYVAGYLSALQTGFSASTNDANAGSGYVTWVSGAYDPAAFTGGGTDSANDSWAAITVALRPSSTSGSCSSAGTGPWATGGTWGAGCTGAGGVPSAMDNVTILNTHNVTVASGVWGLANNITVNSGGTLTVTSTGTLTTYGNFTDSSGGTVTGTGAITLAGTATTIDGSGTMTGLTGLVTITGDKTVQATGVLSLGGGLTISSGTVTNNGSITTAGTFTLTGNWTQGSSSTLKLGGSTSNALTGAGTLTATASGNTVEYSGASPALKSTTYIHLKFSGSGTTTAAGAMTVQGDMTNTGGGTLSFGSQALTLSGTNTASIAGYTTTGLTTFSKTANTTTMTGNISGGAFTMSGSGGTLNLGAGFTHIFTGTYTSTAGTLNVNTSSLELSGAVTTTAATLTASSGTVKYTRAGVQTITVTTYNNLTIGGTGIKTAATTPTVNGTLSIEDSSATPLVVTTGVVTYGASATLQYNVSSPLTATSEEWITPFIATGGINIAGTGAITTPGAVQIGNSSTAVDLTVQSGATLTPGSNLITLYDDFVNVSNGGIITSGSGGLTIAGTDTQGIGAFTTTGTVSMTKTAGTATFSGTINGGAFTMNGSGGTLNLGAGLTHTFTGIWTRTAGVLDGGSSTLKLGSSVSGTGGTFTASTGTVEYNGTSQTIANITYYNLITSGSGTKSLSAALTVSNTLTMKSGTLDTVSGQNYAINAGNIVMSSGTATLLGDNTIGSTFIQVANAMLCTAFPAPVNGGTISQITAYVGGNGSTISMQTSLYQVTGGNLVYVANSTSVSVGTSASWVNFPITATLTSGVTYHLCMWSSSAYDEYYNTGTSQQAWVKNGDTFPSYPSSIPLSVNAGVMDAYDVTDSIYANYTPTPTFTPQASTINLTGTGTVFDYQAGTITPATSTIKITDSSSTAKTFSGGGKTYNDIWFAPGAGTGKLTIAGSNTFANFKDDGSVAHTIEFTAGTTQTITSWTVSGTSGNVITLKSTSNGNVWTLSDTTGTNTSAYVSLQDSTATGGATWTTTNSTSVSGNTGWSFPGGVCTATITGFWNTGGNWSNCGGVGGIPATSDDVVINSSIVITLDVATPVLNSLTINGTLNTLNSSTSYAVNSKSITLGASGTLTANASTITLSGTTGTLFTKSSGTFTAGTSTVTVSGNGSTTLASGTPSFYNITINSTGTKSLGEALTATNILTITNGTLDTSGSNYTVNTGSITINGGTFTPQASTVNISGTSGTLFTLSSGTFTPATSTVVMNGNGTATFNSGTATFYNVTSSGTGTKSLGASTTMSNTLTISAGTFSLSSYILTLSKTTAPITNTATFDGSTGTVVLSGDGSYVIPNVTYYNLTSSGTGTKSLGAALTVTNLLTISGGTIDTTGSNYTLNAGKIDVSGVGGSGIFGYNTIGAGSNTTTSIISSSFTANATASVTKITAYVRASSGTVNMRAAIYDKGIIASQAAPINLLASSSSSTTINTTAQWVDIPIAAYTVTNGVEYYIAVWGDATFELWYDFNGLTWLDRSFEVNTGTFPTWVTPITAGNIFSTIGSYYATYTTGGTLTANASMINLTGTSGTLFTLGSGATFTQGTSTVNMTGNGSATVNSGSPTFYNLTSSGTGTKTLGAGVTLATNGTLSVTAGTFDPSTYTVTGSGTNTLSVGASGTVNVGASTFAGNYSAGFNTLTFNTASVTNYNASGTQTVSGTPTYGHLTISGSGTKTLGANTVAAGTVTVTAGTLDTDVANNRSLTGNEVLINGGILTARASTVNLSGTSGTLFDLSSGTFTAGTSTVNLTGNGSATVNSGSPTFYNLTSSGTGTKTLGAGVTLATNGTLSVTAGTFDPSTYTVTGSGTNTLSVGAGSTIKVNTSTFAGNYSSGFTTKTMNATSTVDYSLAGTQTIDGSFNYGNITISGSGTKTLGAATTAVGLMDIVAGTVDTSSASNYTLNSGTINVGTGTSLLVNNSAVNLSGTSGTLFTKHASGTFTAGGSTVSFTGNGSATLVSGTPTFYNLTSSGTGTKSLAAALSVTNDLVASNGTLDTVSGQNYTISAGRINLNGTGGILLGQASTINITGTSGTLFTLGTGTFTAGTSTVNLTGNGSATVNSGSPTFSNLTSSGTGTKTLGANITLASSKILSITAGTFDPSTYTVTGSGTNTLSVGASGTIKVGASTFAGNYSSGFTVKTFTSGSIVDYSLGGTQTVDNTLLYSNLTISNSGTKTLGGITTATGALTISGGTLDTSNNRLDVGTIAITGGTFTPGSSVISVNGSGTVFSYTSGTFTAGTSVIKFTDTSSSAKTIAGGGRTFNTLWINGSGTGEYTISGSNTIGLFRVDSSPNTIKFTAGTTQTVTNWQVDGSGFNSLITLKSTTDTSVWNLSKTSGSVTSYYLSLRDSVAAGGATFLALNSTSVSGNSGWVFTTQIFGGGSAVESSASIGTCADGIQNGNETGIDTGGRCTGGGAQGGGGGTESGGGVGTCADGIQNGNETGIDTGGRCTGGGAQGGGGGDLGYLKGRQFFAYIMYFVKGLMFV